MTSPARFLIALALGAGIVGPAWARKDDPATQLANITKGRVAGKPQRCISLSDVNDSQVIEKTTIVYRVGNTYYVNQLKSGANSLDADNVPVTHTFGSQLCDMDTVNMVDRYGGGSRGFAILGPFVPYKPAPGTP
ncbi:hypothetical protein [Luteibacter yeojuensis]|uniref:Secreted protein n=1 Tax=Luteibacter yeojuensis TaxID=345309 RepID=A0A7X5QWQ1_9GAMM|nr:hypothetical protein [Luteibacter yeojuensis]NID16710.1 hypothetical protein [Luteibacter yeojuensis]